MAENEKYVKQLESVRDLNNELKLSMRNFDDMDKAAQNVVKSVGGITNELLKNYNTSKKSKKETELIVKANQTALKFAKSKSSEDKKALDKVKEQVAMQTNLSKGAQTQTDALFESINVA